MQGGGVTPSVVRVGVGKDTSLPRGVEGLDPLGPGVVLGAVFARHGLPGLDQQKARAKGHVRKCFARAPWLLPAFYASMDVRAWAGVHPEGGGLGSGFNPEFNLEWEGP